MEKRSERFFVTFVSHPVPFIYILPIGNECGRKPICHVRDFRAILTMKSVAAVVRLHDRCAFHDKAKGLCGNCGHSFNQSSHLRDLPLRDQVVRGLSDTGMQRRILMEGYDQQLTLHRTLQIVGGVPCHRAGAQSRQPTSALSSTTHYVVMQAKQVDPHTAANTMPVLRLRPPPSRPMQGSQSDLPQLCKARPPRLGMSPEERTSQARTQGGGGSPLPMNPPRSFKFCFKFNGYARYCARARFRDRSAVFHRMRMHECMRRSFNFQGSDRCRARKTV